MTNYHDGNQPFSQGGQEPDSSFKGNRLIKAPFSLPSSISAPGAGQPQNPASSVVSAPGVEQPQNPASSVVTSTMERQTGAGIFPSQGIENVLPQQNRWLVESHTMQMQSMGSEKERKKKLILLASVIGVVIILGAIGFEAWKHFAPPDVTAYQVSKQNTSLDVNAGGVIYPNQRLDISYPFASHVLAVFVKPGDRVTPNQALIQLDLSQTNAQDLSQLNAQVAQAQQEMQAAQQYLYSVESTGNAVVIAQAQQQYSAAQAKYNALKAEASSPSLHQGDLMSTMNGIVTAVNVYPGQVFSPNKILLTVFDESSVIVRVKVPVTSYKQVQMNQTAVVTPSAFPDHSYKGTVTSIIMSSDAQTDTFEVWVMVPNPDGDLLPGMNAFAQISNPVKALVVPRLAVLNPDRESIVYVIRDGHAYIQHVQVIGYVNDSVLIGSGLNAGDMIVMVGLDSLPDGQAVHVVSVEGQTQ